MSAWSRRRRVSKPRRTTLVLTLILAMIAVVVPAARNAVQLPGLIAGTTAGAVDVPDHPEGTAFNPNQLKDIKAADPGAGINLINPPGASSQGDARVSYP